MKRITALITAAVLALSLFLLSGCGTPKGNPLPEGMDETQLLDAGREVMALLTSGEYQAVVDALRPDVVEAGTKNGPITAADIESIMVPTIEKAGAFVEETEAMATGQSDKDSGESFGVAVFVCKHEKKNVRYRLAFDTDLTLIGLQVRKV